MEAETDLANSARHRRYSTMASRMATFRDWPSAMPQTPLQLAYAGFFYLGRGDHVQCFYCDGGLKNWDPTDRPWIEHARWFGNCSYLLLKQGHEFVQRVKAGYPPTQEMLNNFEQPVPARQVEVLSAPAPSAPPASLASPTFDPARFPLEVVACTDGISEVTRLEEENSRLRNERLCTVCCTEESQVNCIHIRICTYYIHVFLFGGL